MVIDMAKAFGVMPQKIIGGTKTLWVARFEAYRDAYLAGSRRSSSVDRVNRVLKNGS